MMSSGNQWLKLGGILSFVVALLHLVIIFVGASAYRYFGAPEGYARAAEAGSTSPAMRTLVLVVIFTIWGLYAFSGGGVIRRLPLLRITLLLIGIIYTLRGVFVFQQIFQIFISSEQVEPRKIVFSLVSLIIGLAYLIGTVINWRNFRASNQVIQT